MNIDNTKIQMRKGVLEYCILAIIANKEAYSTDILHQLKQAELIIVEGTLYPLLTRLKNAGLLEYNWQESTEGPPRKYYSITNDGQQFLNELQQSWKHLVSTVNYITK